MVEDFHTNPTLPNMKITTFSLLAFAGFLRFNEAIQVRARDGKFTPSMATVSIPSSKTDPYRQGSEVLMVWTHSLTCPVSMLEEYMA